MHTADNGSARAAFLSEAQRVAVRKHLDAVTSSSAFFSFARSSDILRYICSRALDGKDDQVNEYAIGVDVFNRPESFDPRIDSIVRTEISRLRKRLKDYYSGEGSGATVRIDLPLRSYVPTFAFPEPETVPKRLDPPIPAPASPAGSRGKLLISATVIVVLAGGALGWRSLVRRTPQPSITTLAVLPFVNLSGDPGQGYVGDSVADELTELLSESRDLRVVARTSSFQFKNKSDDVRAIGSRLNAGAVLEGSIQRNGDRFRVIAQLIRTANGFHLWSHTYEASAIDLQRVEAEIAHSATQALLPAGEAANAPSRPVNSANPEAHDLYLRSVYQLQLRTPESVRESLDLAEQAVALDPSYVRAWGAISRAAGVLGELRLMPPREAAARSRAATAKALALDPQYSDAHAWAAMDAYTNDWNWPMAEKEYQLALNASGPHGQVDNLYGWSLMTRKRFTEARNHLQLAEELDPESPGSRANMTTEWIFERKFLEARHEVDGIFKLNPKSLSAIRALLWIALLEGDCAAATSASRKALEWYPNVYDPTDAPHLKITCGQFDDARRQLAALGNGSELSKASPAQLISPYHIAEAYARLHDADHAMEYLEKSAEARETMILYLEVDTMLDPLRSAPRFIALERRIGLRGQ
jgi:adenylate cyclase